MERHLCLGLALGFSCLMVMNLSPEQTQIKAISVGLRFWYSFSSRAPITGIGFPVGGAGPGHLNPPPPLNVAQVWEGVSVQPILAAPRDRVIRNSGLENCCLFACLLVCCSLPGGWVGQKASMACVR